MSDRGSVFERTKAGLMQALMHAKILNAMKTEFDRQSQTGAMRLEISPDAAREGKLVARIEGEFDMNDLASAIVAKLVAEL